MHPDDALANEWYACAPVADAHADSLLWNRDLCKKSNEGHVDFPRLREAGVRVQLFTIPTRGYPLVDGIGWFCARRGWPRDANRSPRSRALYQIEMLHNACARSAGEVAVARTAAELDTNLEAGRLSAVIGIEGAYPLEGNIQSLEEFYDLGVRFLGPSHLIPNEFAGCSTWLYKDRGLSAMGRELLQEMRSLNLILDVAHASKSAADEMLSSAFDGLFTFNSHTGVCGATPLWRNLSDEHARAIARRGGVIAIVLARYYLGEPGVAGFLKHVAHAAAVAGAGNVAIGSDFDGFVRPPREIHDVRDLRKLADVLKGGGFGRGDTIGILGANLVAFLRRALPPV
ncbi:MAG: membrane dipeptidase [Planctomycetes bacterium]|nr:membrane dipeptidase [Planctomycetota bacterium]